MARIKSETVYSDGNYTALVEAFGFEFAAGYVNSEIRLHGTNANCRTGWKLESAAKTVRKLIAARLAELGPEFEAAHKATYAPCNS